MRRTQDGMSKIIETLLREFHATKCLAFAASDVANIVLGHSVPPLFLLYALLSDSEVCIRSLKTTVTSIFIMHLKSLILSWALTAAALHETTDYATAQQAILNDDPSSSGTYEQKTSLAKTILKVSSDGKASGIPEIAKIAVDISAASTVSQEEATELLGLSALQVDFLLAGQKAANVIEAYNGTSTQISNAKDNPHWNYRTSRANGESEDNSAEDIKFKAETSYTIRGTPGQAIEEIRAIMKQFREMPNVRIRAVEWEFSEDSRDQLRKDAKREALRKCLSHGQETATMLGSTSNVMLLEIEETHLWTQEKQEMRQTMYYPARGEEIDARPKEMEMSIRMTCKLGVL